MSSAHAGSTRKGGRYIWRYPRMMERANKGLKNAWSGQRMKGNAYFNGMGGFVDDREYFESQTFRKHAEYGPIRHPYGRVRRQGCAHCAHPSFCPLACSGTGSRRAGHNSLASHLLHAFMVPTTNHCMTGRQDHAHAINASTGEPRPKLCRETQALHDGLDGRPMNQVPHQ